MSHHPHGSLYVDWQRSEAGITALEKEIEQQQVTRVDLKEYEVGSPKYERLQEQIALAKRFTWPPFYSENV